MFISNDGGGRWSYDRIKSRLFVDEIRTLLVSCNKSREVVEIQSLSYEEYNSVVGDVHRSLGEGDGCSVNHTAESRSCDTENSEHRHFILNYNVYHDNITLLVFYKFKKNLIKMTPAQYIYYVTLSLCLTRNTTNIGSSGMALVFK